MKHWSASHSPLLSADSVLEGDGAELPLLPAALAGGVLVVPLGVPEDGVAPKVHAELGRLRLVLQMGRNLVTH